MKIKWAYRKGFVAMITLMHSGRRLGLVEPGFMAAE